MLRPTFPLLVLPVTYLWPAAGALAGPEYTATVTAPNRAYHWAPVAIDVPTPRQAGPVRVTDLSAKKTVPAQVVQHRDHATVRWAVRELPQGASRKYRLVIGEPPPDLQDGGSVKVDLRPDAGVVEVTLNDELFTRYCFAGAPKPYCYPIIGPTGVPVTRSYPMETVEGETQDHPHQRSLWFTHGEVNGIDFWAEGPDKGKQVHRDFLAHEAGPVCGAICSANDWIAPDGKKVCEDVRELRVYNVPEVRLFDFTITVKATEGPVEFGDTKEGTFGIRVASAMDVTPAHPEAHITNSEGQTDGDAWGKAAAWCDYSAPIDGKMVGISILDHPTSFRHPTYWHVRTYGLFAANPFGLRHFVGDKEGKGRFALQQGQEVTFTYRVLIHPGNVEEANVAGWYAEYADPPVVEMK